MKKILSVLLAAAALCLILFPAGAEETASGAEKIVYGTSVQGRELACYRVGEAENEKLVLMVFAVHGFEDEFALDGALLKRIAEDTIQFYANAPERLCGFSLYIVPCANPDGLEAGTTNKGFGRCNADGYDINRDFSVEFVRNQDTPGKKTGAAPFTTPEARAIRDLVEQIHPTYAMDVHGYIEKIYYGADENRQMAQTFAAPFGFSTAKWNSGGMMARWFESVTQGALLIELRSPLKKQSREGGNANVLLMPLSDFVEDQGAKLRAGLENWLRVCGK